MLTRDIRIDGLSTQYLDIGSGPGLLFLHGWGVGFDSYLVMLEHLAKTHRVVAPNLPGMGGAQEPPVAWRSTEFAGFVTHFLSALSFAPDVLAGHSNGGRTLLRLQGTPQTALPAKKLILLDSAGLRPKRSARYHMKVACYKTAKWALTPFPALKARLQKNAGSADYRAASPVMRGTLSLLVNEDLGPLLPHIRASTLLIWGENDTATPLSDGRRMEKEIPGAGLVLLKSGGHWAFLEQWGLCARVLDSFLS